MWRFFTSSGHEKHTESPLDTIRGVMEPIADVTLAAPSPNIDIQNIPATYAHLQIIASLRSADQTGLVGARMRFNNDATVNYDSRYAVGIDHIWLTHSQEMAQSGAPAGVFTLVEGLIARYTDVGERRTFVGQMETNTYDGTNNATTHAVGGTWRNTIDAINRITIYATGGTLAAGSRVTLYGIRASNPTASYVTPAGAVGYGTVLPTSPANGQEFILTNSTTNPSWQWRLRYNANSTSTHKWEFVGGTPLFAEVTTAQSVSVDDALYQALATAGPSIALPLAGDYDVEIGTEFTSGGTGQWGRMSYDIGGTAAVDADSVGLDAIGTTQANTGSRCRRKTGLTAVTLTAKYRKGVAPASWTATFSSRWMRVTPVRIG